MANPPDGHGATKNPGSLAGHTGVRIDLAGQQERLRAYSEGSDLGKPALDQWADACDRMFASMEREARIKAARDTLAELGALS